MYVCKIDNDFKAVSLFTMYLYSTINCNAVLCQAIDPVFWSG